ncbi:hypothetical protein CEXT_400781 [Caerostris extrusa]|uniref:Uncharacterized protein n=1 Tax=Caerostris extrusa TaxID=172846 RepID=A0AAV4TN78_CAEEX|nr:hypothetical protein CEXT_400781 [Caerostris extrusa]
MLFLNSRYRMTRGSTKLAPPSIHYKKHLQKRSHDNFYYDYPENPGSYDYQMYNSNHLQVGNPLQVAGIAGTAGVAFKALKAKSILKLLKIPAGLALLGGIAALAAGLAPPAVIGSISLPFNLRFEYFRVKGKKKYHIDEA